MRDLLLNVLYWTGVPLGILFFLIIWGVLVLFVFGELMDLINDNSTTTTFNNEDDFE